MNDNENGVMNNNSAESSKSKTKTLIAIIIIICFVVISCLALMFFTSNKDEGNKKGKTKEELANSILDELCINDYLGSILQPKMDLNINILDIGTRSNMLMFFYADNDLTKYRLNDQVNAKAYAFARYTDYANEHKRIFGVEPDMTPDSNVGVNVAFAIPNVSGNINSNYQASVSDIAYCDINASNDCFILLLEEHENSSIIKFSNLSIENNVISGKVTRNLVDTYLNGTFEFEYEKSGKDYIAKSLKITSIDDSYNIVEN